MNYSKKVLSILLSLMMVLSFFTIAPLNTAAEEVSDQLMQQESVDGTGDEDLQEKDDRMVDGVLQEDTDEEALQEEPDNEGDAELMADITSWSDLQKAINRASNRSTVVLTQDLTASAEDTQLEIPASKTITIDLNNHTLNRGLTSGDYREDGSVLYVSPDASLTLKNSGGRSGNLTGGRAQQGGAVLNRGSLTIESGVTIQRNFARDGGAIWSNDSLTINGGFLYANAAEGSGGGVYSVRTTNYSETHMTMTGGTIGRNTAGADGGGICNFRGTLSVTGGTISANTAGKFGGGICNNGSLIFEGATVTKNHAPYGGGICSKSGKIDYQSSITGGGITGNSATFGGGVYVGGGIEEAELDILGCQISENQAYDGGGLYIPSNSTVTLHGTTISSNYTLSRDKSGNGGGIYTRGTLEIADATITDNMAEISGGALCVAEGTTMITGGSFTKNIARSKNGGGIFLEGGTLNLQGGTISENRAAENGGGIYADTTGGAVFHVQDSPVVQNNVKDSKTSNVYLPSGSKITVFNEELGDAKIGVTLEKSKGVFTLDYSRIRVEGDNKYVDNPVSPSRYFTSDEGLTVTLDYTEGMQAEAAIQEARGKDIQVVSSFVPKEDLVEPNANKLNGWDWMSGISGERYLNEINLPCTHDSGCNRVTGVGNINEDFHRYAKTQYYDIDRQLIAGVRKFDIRLNNWHPVGTKNWGLTTTWRRDGENLWICHGKSSFGIMYAQDPNGEDLTLKQILKWVKTFLKNNPSETVILEFSPELNTNPCGHNKSSDEERVYNQLYRELYNLYYENNPATGKSYLYTEEGKAHSFVPYTRYPQLKECRGQILIMCEDERMRGLHFGDVGPVEGEGENKCKWDKKVDLVEDFYKNHVKYLPTDADTHFDIMYSVGTTTSGPNSNYVTDQYRPVDIADRVHKELFGKGKLFDEDGRYFGWVRLDGADDSTTKDIWDSNFFDGLQNCGITVKPGLIAPGNVTQSFALLKGTKLTIPNCIYTYDADANGMNFSGWMGESASGTEFYSPGETITVTEDMTFTAQWSYNSVPVKIVWKDGDNRDHLRNDHLVVILYSYTSGQADTYYVNIKEEEGWTTVISDYVSAVLPLSWGLGGTIRSYNGTTGGHDGYMEYRYETTGNQRDGYTITLYHTPNKKVSASGTVVWGDNDNETGKRPESVTLHLHKNGKEIDSRTATSSGGWSYDFGELPLYENGEKIEYTLTEDAVSKYTSVINDFSVTNILTTTMDSMNLIGSVTWDDEDNVGGTRPESVAVHLLADGKEVRSIEIRESEEGVWSWGFDDLPEYNDAGKEIVYSVTQDSVPGYRTEMLADDKYEICNILETQIVTHTVTFDSNGADEVPAQKVVHGGLIQKPEDPVAPKQYYVFDSWHLVENGQIELDGFDFATPITEDIVLQARFVDDRGGAENIRVETIKGAPEIDEDNSYEAAESVFTQEEIDDDFGLVLISSPDVESDEDKITLAARSVNLGVTPADWFDISLYKMKEIWIADSPEQKLQEKTTEKLTSVPVPLKLMVSVPESLRKEGRTYYLLHCHDGEAKLVAQGKDTTLSWESNVFSAYLLAYRDNAPEQGGSSGGGAAVTKYKVASPDHLSNGSVESSTKQAKNGEQVTITVKPEEGYRTASLAVKDAKGNEVEVTDNGDGTYTFIMPSSEVTVIPAFEENPKPDEPGDQACPKDDTCPMTPFTDSDKNEWYHDGVHWAIEEGIMNGTSDNTFEPLTATTRAMIVTMLWRMEGSPQTDGTVTFKDVPDGQWYTDAIRWAASDGIVTGYDSDTFGTNDSVTREQLATILYRSAKSKGQGFTGTWAFPLNFDDADQVSEWADEAMHWMVMNGIIQGMSEKELSPQGDAVRAQVATMLMRFSEKLQA